LRFCIAALLLVASSVARGEELAAPAGEILVEDLSGEFCACDDASSCVGDPISVYIPNLTPGFQFSGGFLLLKPGADNLGWSTITTYLPIQSPQWDVQNINPGYQPGFTVGGRYVFPNSGTDIQTNWEHLRTSDSSSVAVVIPRRSGFLRSTRRGPRIPSSTTRLASSI
jgi:hypothetical protein